MYVMSPTIFSPGVTAPKSRFTRSGIGPALPCRVVDGRHGRDQPADQLGARGDAPAGQLDGDAPVAVRAVGIVKRLPDQELKLFLPFRRRAFRPRPPLIESGF